MSKTATKADTTPRADVYTRVTDRIIEDLTKGVRPWLKPWKAGNTEGRITAPLRHNGTPYKGMNVLLLWGEAFAKGYTSALWMTYKQAAELGAQVRKGEHGALVVYADRITKTEHNERGENVERSIPFMKGYTVFNVEQVDGLPAHYYAKPEPKGDPLPLIEAAERFFTQTGARFQHGGDRAFYAPARDFIQLPPAEAFTDAESYAATKAHELIHWTPGAGWCSGPLTIQPGGARTRGQLEELSTGARRCWRWGTAVPKAIHTLVVWMGRLSTAARSATTGTL